MELTANAQKVFDLVKELSAVELAALVKSLEEEFGVTAAAGVMVAGAAAAGSDDEGPAQKDSFNVELTEIGSQKIAVIKVVKEMMNVSLTDAKTLVEKAPVIIKENVKADEAESLKAKLEEAGASVTVK